MKLFDQQYDLFRLSFGLFFVFSFILFGGCEKQSVRMNYPSSEALSFYAQGMYRYSRDVLLEKGVQNSSEAYLLARDYQELHEPEKAVSVFGNLDVQELKTVRGLPHPLEHYSYYYIMALFDSSVIYTNALQIVSNCLNFIPATSVYREKSENVLFYYLWRYERYSAFTNLKSTNTIANLYQNGAWVMFGKTEHQQDLFYHSYDMPGLFYSRLLVKLDPATFYRAFAIRRVVQLALSFGKLAIAKQFVARYYALSKDVDYKTRNLARIDWVSGKHKTALNRLSTFVVKGRASRLTIRLYYHYLKSRGDHRRMLALLKRARKRYPNSFNESYLTMLQKTRHYTELYRWFCSRVSSYYFRTTLAYSAIRFMLYRRQTKTALKMMDLVLARGDSKAIRLMHALLLLDQGEHQKAYRDFLRIVLYAPFTYEWLVARKYEVKLRQRYRQHYEDSLKKALNFYSRAGLKRKIYYWKALKEIDLDTFVQQVGKTNYQETLKKWYEVVDRAFYWEHGKKNLLDKFRLETNLSVVGWTHEWAGLIKSEIKKLAKRKRVSQYRVLYFYRDVLERLDLQGWVLSRLNTAISSKWGDRRYHAILPSDLQKALYPVSALSEIRKSVSNEDESYSIIAAFREESHFRKRVFSPVGAVGYAQVMPYTARRLKKNLKRPELSMYDYSDNLLLGISLYHYLFSKYHGRADFALAAYNAGEGAVNRWRKQNLFDNELWTDGVEYRETRNYIKKIVLTTYYYRSFYNINIQTSQSDVIVSKKQNTVL